MKCVKTNINRGQSLSTFKKIDIYFQVVHIAAPGNDGVSWLLSAIQPAETATQPLIKTGLTAMDLISN